MVVSRQVVNTSRYDLGSEETTFKCTSGSNTISKVDTNLRLQD
jgi:hypothetical protein